MLRILIIEKDRQLTDIVSSTLKVVWRGSRISATTNHVQALNAVSSEQPDLVVIGLSKSSPQGIELCRDIRGLSAAPILVLSENNAVEDRIEAFDNGADEFLVKPFNELELLARVRVMARRYNLDGRQIAEQESATASLLEVGAVSLDLERHQAFAGNKPLKLTSTEFRLLVEFVRNAGSVIPSAHLLERVWGPQYLDSPHYLKVFVHRLRRKLDPMIQGSYFIQNEWGIGYRFVSSLTQ